MTQFRSEDTKNFTPLISEVIIFLLVGFLPRNKTRKFLFYVKLKFYDYFIRKNPKNLFVLTYKKLTVFFDVVYLEKKKMVTLFYFIRQKVTSVMKIINKR